MRKIPVDMIFFVLAVVCGVVGIMDNISLIPVIYPEYDDIGPVALYKAYHAGKEFVVFEHSFSVSNEWFYSFEDSVFLPILIAGGWTYPIGQYAIFSLLNFVWGGVWESFYILRFSSLLFVFASIVCVFWVVVFRNRDFLSEHRFVFGLWLVCFLFPSVQAFSIHGSPYASYLFVTTLSLIICSELVLRKIRLTRFISVTSFLSFFSYLSIFNFLMVVPFLRKNCFRKWLLVNWLAYKKRHWLFFWVFVFCLFCLAVFVATIDLGEHVKNVCEGVFVCLVDFGHSSFGALKFIYGFDGGWISAAVTFVLLARGVHYGLIQQSIYFKTLSAHSALFLGLWFALGLIGVVPYGDSRHILIAFPAFSFLLSCGVVSLHVANRSFSFQMFFYLICIAVFAEIDVDNWRKGREVPRQASFEMVSHSDNVLIYDYSLLPYHPSFGFDPRQIINLDFGASDIAGILAENKGKTFLVSQRSPLSAYLSYDERGVSSIIRGLVKCGSIVELARNGSNLHFAVSNTDRSSIPNNVFLYKVVPNEC